MDSSTQSYNTSTTEEASETIAAAAGSVVADSVPLRIRYRIRFEKRDLLRWIGHSDLARLWDRIIRRAGLKPSMTEGFHPKPRIGFPSALALGVEGLDEVLEIDLAEEPSPGELLERLADDNQPGLIIKSVYRLPESIKKAQLQRSDYTISLPDSLLDQGDIEVIEEAIEQFKSKETVTIERKKKQVVATVATDIPKLEFIPKLGLGESHLILSLAATSGASLKPNDVLDLLGFVDWLENGSLITRTRVVLENELDVDDPNEFAVAPSSEETT